MLSPCAGRDSGFVGHEVKLLNRVQLFATPWTYHAPPSMGFSRQEYWSGLPFPSPILGTSFEKLKKNKTKKGVNTTLEVQN